jgi:hypothetical protein
MYKGVTDPLALQLVSVQPIKANLVQGRSLGANQVQGRPVGVQGRLVGNPDAG